MYDASLVQREASLTHVLQLSVVFIDNVDAQVQSRQVVSKSR